MPLDAVIVTHNSAAHLRHCIGALPDDVSVVVVDNASTDGSADVAESLGATVIRNAANAGFAAAANQGARAGSSEVLLFVNPDAVVAASDLRVLADRFDADARVGAAAPRLVHPDGSVQRTWWPFPSAWSTWLEAIGVQRLRQPTLEEDGQAPFLVGACLCVRRSAFDDVGGFDERFWLYGEDADLGRRLADAGWTSQYVPEVAAHHVGGESGAFDPAGTFEHFQRGTELFIAKHEGAPALVAHRLGLLVGSAIRIPLLAAGRDPRSRQRLAERKAIVARLGRILLRHPARVSRSGPNS